MKVLIWIAESTWRACVDAARTHVPAEAELVLLHVTSSDISAAVHGAFSGLLGRGHREDDPGKHLEQLATASADELLNAAGQRLGRPAAHVVRHGRIEQEVMAAAETCDLLILARDGDYSRRGPKSIGHATRFVVDHAPCALLLVWPGQ